MLAGSTVIAFLLKAPRPGEVKTRLARTVGRDRACAIYRWLVERQAAALPRGWPVAIHFSPSNAEGEMRAWLGPRFEYQPQPDGDLGARMLAAAEAAFAAGATRVLLVGADCPALRSEDLEMSARLLAEGADAVFGPAMDGGYYLLGLRYLEPKLFAGIPWSSPETLAQSLGRCRSLGLRVAQLSEQEDIDDKASLDRAVAAGLIPREIGGAK